MRKNKTVFPATDKTPETTHTDLLIVYQGEKDQQAIYFDNEGHTIKYKVSFNDKSIVLTGDIMQNAPRFRLSYTTIDAKTVNISFEMASSQKPEEFKMYLEGKSIKVK